MRFHFKTVIILSIGILLITAALTATTAFAQACEDPEIQELGAKLYSENCAVCHGIDGQGRVGATLAKDWPSIRPDLRVRDTIINGGPGLLMPAWSIENGGPLEDNEIDALVCYILTWETGGPPFIYPTPTPIAQLAVTAPPEVSGDVTNGANIFLQNCAVCHGERGEGRIGAELSLDLSSVRPDLLVRSVISNGVEDTAMPAWSQANGGPLTEAEIDDAAAYVLTLGAGANPVVAAQEPGRLQLPWPILLAFIILVVATIAAIIYFTRRYQTQSKD